MDSRFLDVNKNGVLRVPNLIWVALALLARYWVLVVVVAVSSRRGGETLLLLGGGISWQLLVTESPALVLALIASRRDPQAGSAIRFMWRHGRVLMALAATANALWTISLLMQSSYWMLWPELFLASCTLLDVAIVLSIYTNPYFRQVFREFPARPPEGAT